MNRLNQIVIFIAFLISITIFSIPLILGFFDIIFSGIKNKTDLIITVISFTYLIGIIGLITLFQMVYKTKPKLVISLLSFGVISVVLLLLLLILLENGIGLGLGKNLLFWLLLIIPFSVQIHWIKKIKKTITHR